jgi:hypothetical protein
LDRVDLVVCRACRLQCHGVKTDICDGEGWDGDCRRLHVDAAAYVRRKERGCQSWPAGHIMSDNEWIWWEDNDAGRNTARQPIGGVPDAWGRLHDVHGAAGRNGIAAEAFRSMAQSITPPIWRRW